jgi:hypothetical protein
VFGGIGKDRPLYNLPELLAANSDRPTAMLEGEQKADLMTRLDFLATTTSQGAGNAEYTDFSPLVGRIVHLYADNDTAGADHMLDIAQRAYDSGAASVWLVTLPNLPPKGDIVDYYETRRTAGATDEAIADEIRDAVGKAIEVQRQPAADVVGDEPEQDDKAVASADTLADLVVAMAADVILFHDEQGEAFATIEVDGHSENWRISSRQFTQWIASRVYRAHKIAVPSQAMSTAVATLSAMALFDGDCQAVHMRIARGDGAIWIDLCDEQWRAVEVTPAGWRVVERPPVRFVRRAGMKALPLPQSGFDSLDPLFDLLHVDNGETRLLVTSWLVNALFPSSSFPTLSATGEQGSGKSTFCRALQRLVDPHQVEGRSPPRNEEDIAVAAQHAHVLVYENLSSISQQLSDAFCRVATGAGFAARKLYTNDEERQLAFCRPLIINGIGDLATRSDLADRLVNVQLEPIPRQRRQTEGSLWRAYEAMQPRLFGALLSLVAKVTGIADQDLQLERMAEYSQIGAKVAIALGLGPEAFTHAYRSNRDGSSLGALDSSSVGPVLLRLVRSGEVRCPIGGLLRQLLQNADEYERRHPEWPRTPRGLGDELRRLSPNLARIGVNVQFLGRRNDGIWVAIQQVAGPDVHEVHDVHEGAQTDAE